MSPEAKVPLKFRVNTKQGPVKREDGSLRASPPQPAPKPVINVATGTNSGIHWSRGELIGQGQFGAVYRGLNLDSGEPIALKQIHFAQDTAKAKEQVTAIQNEIAILQTLQAHPSTVSYLGTDRHGLDLFILMELVAGGSIASQLKVHGPMKETLVRKWTREIVLGLLHLHGNGIIHRDIKGANILITSSGHIKLADFGCAKQRLGPSAAGFTSVCGTPFWMAPEVIQGQPYGTAADVWSLGATVLEMLNGRPPWAELGQLGAMNALAKHQAELPIPPHASALARDFLSKCLNYDPSERLSCAELLHHPWLCGAMTPSPMTPRAPTPPSPLWRPLAVFSPPLPPMAPPEARPRTGPPGTSSVLRFSIRHLNDKPAPGTRGALPPSCADSEKSIRDNGPSSDHLENAVSSRSQAHENRRAAPVEE